MLSELALLALGFFLAFVNGANDVSKGIATLVGSGVASLRGAILWGTLWTVAGGLLGFAFARDMVATFGTGLLTPRSPPTFAAAAATLLGAGAWVLFATRTGFPVSTTHAIVGSLAGAVTLAHGTSGVRWSALGGKILLPLLASPFLALLLVLLVLAIRRTARGNARAPHGPGSADCFCVEIRPVVSALALAPGGAGASAFGSVGAQAQVVSGVTGDCVALHPRALRLTLDHVHWVTSGATSLARGMNDAPKIAALCVASAALGAGAAPSLPGIFLLVTAGMALGSLLAGRRVTSVLGEKVAAMDPDEGFVANLVTAALVAGGATLGLPMSTTHVSAGGIVGAGVLRSSLDLAVLRSIALAWVVTLPAAALLGMAGHALARAVGLP